MTVNETDDADGDAGVIEGEAEAVSPEMTASSSASPDPQDAPGQQPGAGAEEAGSSPEPAAASSGSASGDGEEDDAPDASVQRFYADTLAQVKAARTAGERADALKGAKANALWDHLSEGQRAAIEKAAG